MQQEIHRLGAQARSLPPQLESLLGYWLQKCEGRTMPARDDLPVRELRPWLGHLALIDVADEQDIRIRLCGTNLIRRYGREATGAGIDELALDIARQLKAILKATVKANAPIVAVSHIPLGRTMISYCEAALPLAGPGGLVGTVLIGGYEIQRA